MADNIHFDEVNIETPFLFSITFIYLKSILLYF